MIAVLNIAISYTGERDGRVPKGKWCRRPGSNRRHMDFQSIALPTKLPRHAIVSKLARTTGLEPATFGVTGRRSNQLSYARVLAKRHYDLSGGHRARQPRRVDFTETIVAPITGVSKA